MPAPRVPGFAAVEIVPVPPPLAGGAAQASPGLVEIELVGGDRVRISGPADPATVATVPQALAER